MGEDIVDVQSKAQTEIPGKALTLVSVLRDRAQEQGEQTGYTFLKDGELETESWTYYELERRVRAIGAKLQSLGKQGDRALLLYPPGLEFVSAFSDACMRASSPFQRIRPVPTILSPGLSQLWGTQRRH